MNIDPRALPAVSQWDDRLDTFVKAVLVKLADFLPSLLGAVVVLVAFWGLHRLLRGMLNRSLAGRTSLLAADILRKLLKYVVLGIGLLMAASQLGFNVLSMLAGLGVAGLAVGLAAKDTMANFIAGLIILCASLFNSSTSVSRPPTIRSVGARTLGRLFPARSVLPPRETMAATSSGFSAAAIRAAEAPVLEP